MEVFLCPRPCRTSVLTRAIVESHSVSCLILFQLSPNWDGIANQWVRNQWNFRNKRSWFCRWNKWHRTTKDTKSDGTLECGTSASLWNTSLRERPAEDEFGRNALFQCGFITHVDMFKELLLINGFVEFTFCPMLQNIISTAFSRAIDGVTYIEAKCPNKQTEGEKKSWLDRQKNPRSMIRWLEGG